MLRIRNSTLVTDHRIQLNELATIRGMAFFGYFMNENLISVVMPVFNEQDTVERTMQSILNQDGINLELIVVDDGSVDNTGIILNELSQQDERITVISQRNQGITHALINGCRQAKGEFIARQDAGDWSLPGRLESQLNVLTENPNVVLCSTGARYFSERGELLFDVFLTEDESNEGLKAASLNSIKGPAHHGCTMFRRNAYEQCGGYRAAFVVAQDLDLWTRLASMGEHIALQEIYYEAVLRRNAISAKQRKSQEITRQHIFECSQLRKKTGNDAKHVDQLTEKLAAIAPIKINTELEYNYFVGSLLFKNSSLQCRYYFKKSLTSAPWHVKSWVKLISSYA